MQEVYDRPVQDSRNSGRERFVVIIPSFTSHRFERDLQHSSYSCESTLNK